MNEKARNYVDLFRKVKIASAATVDEQGRPQSRIINVMIASDEGMYIVTSKGKPFYKQLVDTGRVALSAMCPDCQSLKFTGKVKMVDKKWVDRVFEENPGMNEVYPGDTRYILDAFLIYEGSGEWFDLLNYPINRETFSYNASEEKAGFEIQKNCIGCRACARICAHGAPQFGADGKATIDTDKCVGCARCLAVCPKDAIQCLYDEAPAILNKKIAEYTKAVVDGRPCFHVSLVVDVSPNCDCHAENDVPIVPDVGMFASFDPVALDQACADAVLAQTPAPNSALFDEGCDCSSGDYFHAAHPDTDWAVCLEHAEKIGIGTRAYELIKI